MKRRNSRRAHFTNDQPDAAEMLALQALQKAFLESCPGRTAGALAALAGGFPRAKAQPLYVLAFQILGPDRRGCRPAR